MVHLRQYLWHQSTKRTYKFISTTTKKFFQFWFTTEAVIIHVTEAWQSIAETWTYPEPIDTLHSKFVFAWEFPVTYEYIYAANVEVLFVFAIEWRPHDNIIETWKSNC